MTVPDQGRDRRPGVTFFPDYRATNPYQTILYRQIPAFRFEPGGIAVALQRLRASKGVDCVFHLHWTSPVLGHEAGWFKAWLCLRRFLGQIKTFRKEGGRLVWTVHNLFPHECLHRTLETWLHRSLCKQADVIHVHGERTLALAAPHYKLPRARVVVGGHGSFTGYYPATVDRAAARRRLGLADDALVLLFFGQIRAYKGIETLLAAHHRLQGENQRVRLVIAGKPVFLPQETLNAWAAAHPAVRFEARHIPDDEVQVLFAAADVAVLPYVSVLTSGTVFLALGFGLPIICPALGLLPDVIEDGVNGLLYGGAKGQTHDQTLEDALRRFTSLSPEARAALGQHASAAAVRFDWSQAAQVLAAAFRPTGSGSGPGQAGG